MGQLFAQTSKEASTLKNKLPFFALSAFPCFGLWTIHTWIFWLNNHKPFAVEGAESWNSIYFVQSIFLAFAVLVFLHSKKPAENRIVTSDVVFAIAGFLATLLYGWGSMFSSLPEWACYVAITLGGICLGAFYLRWGVFYTGLDLKDALSCIFIACILGALAKSLLDILPEIVGFLFALSLPLLSVIFLRSSFKKQQPVRSSERLYTKETFGSLWKVAACIAIYSFIFSFILSLPKMHDTVLPYAALVGHAIEIAVSLFVLWWVLDKGRSLNFPQLWRLIMIFMGLMLVFAVFEPTAGLQRIFSTSISYLVVVFLWLLLSDISHHSDFHPFVIFGAGWVTYTLPKFFGHLLGGSGLIAPAMSAPLALTLLFIIMLTVSLLLETRNPTMQRIFADLDEAAPAPQEFALIDERCEALGGLHGLTAREVEVMQMICKGRSKAYIAETLFITENTVRGHSRRLYTKLNVHSKKELQELIGV